MSADLEQLLPPIRTHNSAPSGTATDAATRSTIATTIGAATSTENSENGNTDIDPIVIDYNEEDEGYNTPTSEEHRIPQLKSPPPAPRKKRVRYEPVSFVQKSIPEFGRVIKVDYEEIDKFFRSAFDALNEERLRQRRKCFSKSN